MRDIAPAQPWQSLLDEEQNDVFPDALRIHREKEKKRRRFIRLFPFSVS